MSVEEWQAWGLVVAYVAGFVALHHWSQQVIRRRHDRHTMRHLAQMRTPKEEER